MSDARETRELNQAMPGARSKFFKIVAGLALAAAMIEAAYSGAVAFLASEYPSSALMLKGNDAPALVLKSQTELFFSEKPESKANVGQIAAQLRQALREEPLNAHALGLYGQVAPPDQTRAVMEMAARQSKHDVIGHLWLAQDAVAQNKVDTALEQFDICLRSKPALVPALAPFLTALIENPQYSAIAKAYLTRNPEWLDYYLRNIPQTSRDVRTAFDVYSSLQAAKIPVRQEVKNEYSSFLVKKNFHDFAYVAWLQLLDSDQLADVKYLFNASFARASSHDLFDWNSEDAVDAQMMLGVREGEDTLMELRFGADRDSTIKIFQYFKLPPGKFVFKGDYRSDLSISGLMTWRVRCLPDMTLLAGQSAPIGGRKEGWTPFQFSLDVPQKGCVLGIAELRPEAHSHAGSFSSGVLSFRKFVVEPAGVP